MNDTLDALALADCWGRLEKAARAFTREDNTVNRYRLDVAACNYAQAVGKVGSIRAHVAKLFEFLDRQAKRG